MMRALCTGSRLAVQSEQELVAAVRTGDDHAFEQLHARYWERIFSFILGRVHDHGRAEDVAQEVFISALRRLRSDDRQIALKPWLYEIAKNACVDEFRRRSRSREVPLPDDVESLTERLSPSSAARTPVAAVASRQQLDDLRGAFGGLSDGHRQLLVMREFEGLSYDEIGERLGMTRQMVESGLFRARRKLTEEYEQLASGRRCEQVQSAIEAGSLDRSASLGVRERRRVARHLAHCQPCRHVALMAGVDEALVRPRSIAARIAALLPLPFARWPRFGGGRRGGARAAASGAQHHAAATASLQGAAGLGQPAASAGLAPTVAAVAALAITGAGGGLLHLFSGSAPPDHPPHVARHLDRGQAGAAPIVSLRQAERAGRSVRPLVREHHGAGTAQPMSGRHRSGSAGANSGSGVGAPGSPTETGPARGARGRATATPSGAQAATVPGDAAGVAGAAGSAVNGVSGAGQSVTGTVLGATAGAGQSVVGGVINGAAVSGAGTAVSGTVNGVTAGVGSTGAGATGSLSGSGAAGTPSGSGALTGASGATAGPSLSGAAQSVGSVGASAAETVSSVTGPVS